MEFVQLVSAGMGAYGIVLGFTALIVGVPALFKNVGNKHKRGTIHGNLTVFGRITAITGVVMGFLQLIVLMKYSPDFGF